MIKQFDRLRASMVATIRVPKEETNRYGILEGEEVQQGILRIKSMVEKPSVGDAPSNIAAIGRYIFTPKIFEFLALQQQGAGGEIQVTDAMVALLSEQPVFGVDFEGTRFDCGDKAGFQMANLAFALEHPEIRDELRAYLKKMVC